MMLVIYLGILAAIIIFFITRPVKKYTRTYKVAKAGGVDQVSPLTREINDLSNKTFKFGNQLLNTDDYEIFIVDGESMADIGIHTGNAVFVTKVADRLKLNAEKENVIVFAIDPTRYKTEHPDDARKEYGFKIRQFLGYIDLSKEDELLYEELKSIDPAASCERNRHAFLAKIAKARQYFSGLVIVSATYKEEGKDYSIHSLSELYGVVNYIIPKEVIKSI